MVEVDDGELEQQEALDEVMEEAGSKLLQELLALEQMPVQEVTDRNTECPVPIK